MKKIYVKEWMLFQPYERQDEVDTYYVNVANHIAGCLKDCVGGRYPELDEYTIIIVEEKLDADLDYADECGFDIYRVKKYKTNKCLFY